jgi:hypothetical protein
MQHNGNHTADKYFYLHDRLGSVREVIYANDTVKNHYTYKPFGELIDAEGTRRTERIITPRTIIKAEAGLPAEAVVSFRLNAFFFAIQ